MIPSLFVKWTLAIALAALVSTVAAQEGKRKKTGSAPATKKAAATAPVPAPPAPVLESLVLLPEPRALRTERSVTPVDAQKTVLTAAREIAGPQGVETYSAEDFKKFGLSVETFADRAKKAADKRLAGLQPEVIKDAQGKILYAVYRGDSPLMASLLVAPSLPNVFEEMFGPEIWVALPDRHSLFVFPAKTEAVEEFVPDLAERYRTDVHAASPEIFSIKKGSEPRVVGSFAG